MMNENLTLLLSDRPAWYLIGLRHNVIVAIDGGHDDVSGVQTARVLHDRLFGDRYAGVTWRAIFVQPVPDGAVSINDEAATICRDLLNARRADGDDPAGVVAR